MKEGVCVAIGHKRVTFVVTSDMETSLDSAKKDLFYDRTRSDMIRELVSAGLRALETAKAAKKRRGRGSDHDL